jgi:hypothetical protein
VAIALGLPTVPIEERAFASEAEEVEWLLWENVTHALLAGFRARA